MALNINAGAKNKETRKYNTTKDGREKNTLQMVFHCSREISKENIALMI